MTLHSPILLCLPKYNEESEDLGLPIDSDNIFQRLIRNPHLDSDTPRERECTEMLCSVLCNSRILRSRMLRWLGSYLNDVPSDFDQLSFEIDTEGSIGSKRDDLRIEGWRQTGEEGLDLVVLWSVEVKVGAHFHESSLQNAGTDEIDSDADATVNQLINYDRWLREQSAKFKAGFVLALYDMSQAVPSSLAMPWHCLTWTEIGQQVQESLEQDELPPSEELLAKHLLGFIKRHLWRVSDMSRDRIDFDDLALLRAFSEIGIDCEKKINRLVGLLPDIIEEMGIGCGKIGQSATLFRTTLRAVSNRRLFEPEVWDYPTLMLGVKRNDLAVWLETVPSNEKKGAFNEVLQSLLPALHERNPRWHVCSPEDRTWRDIELRSPLVDLLVAEDQDAFFTDFFRRALDDLKQVRVVEAIRECVSKKDQP